MEPSQNIVEHLPWNILRYHLSPSSRTFQSRCIAAQWSRLICRVLIIRSLFMRSKDRFSYDIEETRLSTHDMEWWTLKFKFRSRSSHIVFFNFYCIPQILHYPLFDSFKWLLSYRIADNRSLRSSYRAQIMLARRWTCSTYHFSCPDLNEAMITSAVYQMRSDSDYLVSLLCLSFCPLNWKTNYRNLSGKANKWSEEWRMKNEKWRMKNEKWKKNTEKWKMKKRKWSVFGTDSGLIFRSRYFDKCIFFKRIFSRQEHLLSPNTGNRIIKGLRSEKQ